MTSDTPAPAEPPAGPDAPPTPEHMLGLALDAFERGDYHSTRNWAERILASGDEETRAPAERLLLQMQTPRLTKVLLALTGTLLALVTFFAYAH